MFKHVHSYFIVHACSCLLDHAGMFMLLNHAGMFMLT